MLVTRPKIIPALILSLLTLTGCASLKQNANEVLIRDPNIGHYSPPSPVKSTAKLHWEYAAMSENAYQVAKLAVATKQTTIPLSLQENSSNFTKEAFDVACSDNSTETIHKIPLRPSWTKWDSFPSDELQQRMLKYGMYLEVFEREEEPHTIVVVFEGTNFSDIHDWEANLHWFLRFIPGFTDQYTLAAQDVAKEFYNKISSTSAKYKVDSLSNTLASANGNPIKIVTAGHSLGGGLAQHFAYTFTQNPPESRGYKVSEVFAFDPSPVTGWFSASNPPRNYNAEDLVINRAFEHGEVLAYLRLLTSNLTIGKENPTIWEYRYNFDQNIGGIRNHSMRHLACGLALAAQPWLKK